MKWKLMAPPNFDIKYPNHVRQKCVPTYHERVILPSDGIVETRDERTCEALIRMGFSIVQVFGQKPQANYFSVEEENIEVIMFEDIEELEGPGLDYCKYCGKGFEEVTKDHVENEHQLEWEEYTRLPEMLPPLALKIYWASKGLQEAFEEPLNLLCNSGMYANLLDFFKTEGIHRWKAIAEYYGVPFNPKKRSIVQYPKEDRDFEEYCKICGAKAVSIESHIVGHGIPMVEYKKIDKKVPDIVLDMWHHHSDLRKAFPEPCNLNKGHSNFKNLVDWCMTDGVRKHPHLRTYFRGKSPG